MQRTIGRPIAVLRLCRMSFLTLRGSEGPPLIDYSVTQKSRLSPALLLMAHSETQLVLFRLELRRVDTRDFLQILDRLERPILLAVCNDRRSLGAFQRQPALEVNGLR